MSSPIPTSRELSFPIHQQRDTLLEEDSCYPAYAATSDICGLIFDDESTRGLRWLVCPTQHNKAVRHAWWAGRDFDEIMAHYRAGLPPPPRTT
jgi:hypothetical protein